MLEVDHGISENLKIMQSRSKMKTEYLKYLDKNHGLILYNQINEQINKSIYDCIQKVPQQKYKCNWL